jgi:hypothetical protein
MERRGNKTISGATGKILAMEIKRMRAQEDNDDLVSQERWKDRYQKYRETRDLVLKQEYFDWSGPLYFQEDPRVLFAALYAPFQLERFLLLGSCICLDCLLYVYTFLPLQLIVLCWHSMSGYMRRSIHASDQWGNYHIYPRHVITVVNAFVLLVAALFLTVIDYQVVLHVLNWCYMCCVWHAPNNQYVVTLKG